MTAGAAVKSQFPCRLLVVKGAGHIVSVDRTANVAIRVTGASNRITWRAPGKTQPRISSAGAGNLVRQAR